MCSRAAALALGSAGFWEAIEDEVEVEYACDGDVNGAGKWSSDCGVLYVPHGRKFQPTGNADRGAESAPSEIFPSQILSAKTIPSLRGCALAVGFIPE
jgi:hypothetical protein